MGQKHEAWSEICRILSEAKLILAKYLDDTLGATAATTFFNTPETTKIADYISTAYPILEYNDDCAAIDNRNQVCIDAIVAFSQKYGNPEATPSPEQKIICVAIDTFSAINSSINMFQRTSKMSSEDCDQDGLSCMENTCWECLFLASEVLGKYDLSEIQELRNKFESYLQANDFIYKQFVAGRISSFSHELKKEILSELIIGGERILRAIYTDGIELKPPCNLYHELALFKLREQFQETWLVTSVTNILNFTSILKAFRRAVSPNIDHSFHRKNYLSAITSIIWALYVKSIGNDDPQKTRSNTFKIIDPNEKLYQFLSNYRDLTGLWSDFTLPLKDGFAINFRFKGGDHPLPILPNQMSRITVRQKTIGNVSCLIIQLSDALVLNVADLYASSLSFAGLEKDERSISPDLEQRLDMWFGLFCHHLGIASLGNTSNEALPIYKMWNIMNVDIDQNYPHIDQPTRKIAANNRQMFINILISRSIKTEFLNFRECDERIIDLSEYPDLFFTADFSQAHLLESNEYTDYNPNPVLERLSFSIFKAAYHLLVDTSPALALKNAKLSNEYLLGTTNKDLWLQIFESNNLKVALFGPVVLTPQDSANTVLLSDVLKYYTEKLAAGEFKDLRRLIIPIGEVTEILTLRRAHLLPLVIDIVEQDGALKYTAAIIDPLVYSAAGREAEIKQALSEHFGDKCTPLTREYISHEGFFDTVSCGYFTLKIIRFLLDNPEAKSVTGNIPAPDSWYGTSHNWLSKEDQLSVYKGAWHNFRFFNGVSLAESLRVKDDAARVVTRFVQNVGKRRKASLDV